MSQAYSPRRGTKKHHRPKRRPLDDAQLQELALAYVARFATTAGKLEDYLRRKLRERGYAGEEEGEGPPDYAGLVESFVEKGYVDDAGYARSKSSDLLARGYGARRVSQALYQAGISEEISEELEVSELALRKAAVTLARKRRFGPFDVQAAALGPDERRKREEKQLAAMIRAGHDFAKAKQVLSAPGEEHLLEWIDEAREHEDF